MNDQPYLNIKLTIKTQITLQKNNKLNKGNSVDPLVKFVKELLEAGVALNI